MTSKYSIKDLEQLSGIKAHTIRIWEQRYNILEPERTDTNIRYYLDSHLKKLLNIALLVHNGVKISKLAKLSDKDVSNMVLEQVQYKGDFETQISTLKIAMLDFNQELFEKVLNSCVFQFGMDDTFNKVLGTFINQIGFLWQTGSITVAHEHFISNLIRQKLFTAIDQVMVNPRRDVETLVFYLPAEETHELSLLYLYYYMKKKGYPCIYLGQDVPSEFLKEIFDINGARSFISIFTTKPNEGDLDLHFSKLDELFGKNDCWFYMTGYQLRDFKPTSTYDDTRYWTFKSVEDIKNHFN
jgi:DNA-binding transcriptional MerR regulator